MEKQTMAGDEDSVLVNGIDTTSVMRESLWNMLPEFTKKFEKVWKEMGISPSVHMTRVETVIEHIQNLLIGMINEEENLLDVIRTHIQEQQKELLKLSQELGESPFQAEENLPLVQLEKEMRIQLDKWHLDKHERLKILEKLRKTEEILCQRLALPAHHIGIGEDCIPTAKQLDEIKANINYMENKLVKSEETFRRLRKSILNLWEELEIEGGFTDLETELASDSAEESFVLSQKNLDYLKELESQLQKKKTENSNLATQLREQLANLWIKLDVEESERKQFMTCCERSKPSAVQKLKDEVNKYEDLKLQHVEKFIHQARRELVELWDKCFYGEAERRDFTPAYEDNFSEESLEMHEHQVAVMTNYYEENKQIFKLVEKRESLWKKLLEIENKENNPDRLFSNRGGALLKELKVKNAVHKGLPKVEEELKKTIGLWQKENERLFLVNGEKYLKLMEEQNKTRNQQKEEARLGKQKAKKETIVKEMTFGSKPKNTSMKRTTSPARSPHMTKKRAEKVSIVSSLASSTSNSNTSSAECTQRQATGATTNSKTKKNPRRLSSKVCKKSTRFNKMRPSKAFTSSSSSSRETTVVVEDDDEEASVESLSTYSEFSGHLRNPEKEILSSTTQSQMATTFSVADKLL